MKEKIENSMTVEKNLKRHDNARFTMLRVGKTARHENSVMLNLFKYLRIFMSFNAKDIKPINAFTLAEVLITLGIIGVVAAMTMPTLIQKYQEKATVTKVKKFYSMLSQAYQMAIVNNGSPEEWGLTSEILLTNLQPYLKFIEYCPEGNGDCHSGTYILENNGNRESNYFTSRPSARLADGLIMQSLIKSGGCSYSLGSDKNESNICGEYTVDINGDNKPNQYGKDIFLFHATKYGVIAAGNANYTADTNFNFKRGCLGTGWGCTAWVIYNGNLDYLHCPDELDWDKKRSCKK